jgi:membrane-associated phospholipid phosphatase
MKQLSKVPKIWLSVLLYFILVEIIVLFRKPALAFQPNFIGIRILFFISFIAATAIKKYFKKNIFNLINAIIVFALMTFLYKETAILNTLIFPKIDGFLSHLDQKIFGFQPSLRFSETFDSWFFSELFYFGYFSYYLLPLAAFLIIYLKIPQKIEEFSFILITSFLLYYFTFILIPAEGPQFYFPFPENTIEAQGIFGNMIKLIQKNGEVPTAAFPSSHVGISWIVIFWLYQNFRKSVKFFIPFVVLLMFSTVYIKAHYFVDVVAGFISAPIVFFLTFKFYKFLNHKLDVRFN